MDRPIGIFDSGVGGLSVMVEIQRLLPREDIFYFADSAYCPYGSRPPEVVARRAVALGDFLVAQGAKMVVVASNTTSSAGLETLREWLPVPVVGMEPAVKPAVALTKNGKIGVMATAVTLSSGRFESLVERFGHHVEVLTQPCPGLVELVEEGKTTGPEVEELLHRYLDPLLGHGSDTIVLGCTHYPFLRQLVERIAGPAVQVIDTGEAVAAHVVRVLAHQNLLADRQRQGWARFFTSGDPFKVGEVIAKLLNQRVNVEHLDIS